MDGPDDERARPAGLGEGERRARAHELGPVHVVVDDLGPEVGQQRGHRTDRDGVVGLVDDVDRDPQRAIRRSALPDDSEMTVGS